MLNIKSIGVEPYTFNDGEKVIVTRTPSQAFYQDLIADRKGGVEPFKIIESVIDFMLFPEDAHYKEELPFDVKVILMKDYLEYHARTLEERFRSSNIIPKSK